jgi:uncharacterized protein YjbJ (UPF0337 family)
MHLGEGKFVIGRDPHRVPPLNVFPPPTRRPERRNACLTVWKATRPGTSSADDRGMTEPRASTGGTTMEDRIDEAKGRTKEAVGALTDDDELRREGKMDRAGASVKRKVREGKDAIDERVDDALHDDR